MTMFFIEKNILSQKLHRTFHIHPYKNCFIDVLCIYIINVKYVTVIVLNIKAYFLVTHTQIKKMKYSCMQLVNWQNW